MIIAIAYLIFVFICLMGLVFAFALWCMFWMMAIVAGVLASIVSICTGQWKKEDLTRYAPKNKPQSSFSNRR